jgi:hypothetical protein
MQNDTLSQAGSDQAAAREGAGEIEMTRVAVFNVAGLLMNFAGIILLFSYGIPFRARTDRRQIEVTTPEAEQQYDNWGWFGLALIILGTLSQVLAALL